MKHPLTVSVSALTLAIVACTQDASAPEEANEEVASAALVKETPLAQTPGDAYADYQRALQAPVSRLAETDEKGRARLYYGRVFVRSSVESAALDVLWFRHDISPFLDEYRDVAQTPTTAAYDKGHWEYAIGTGVQWNVLIRYRGIVSAIEMNPRMDKSSRVKTPHPMMDQAVDPTTGSLILDVVGRQGLMLPTPKRRPTPCGQSAIHAMWFGSDLLDDVEGAISDASDWVMSKIKEAGGDIGSVIEQAGQGVLAAIDVLRELGNAGVCALTGKRAHSGIIYVEDPDSAGRNVKMRFGPNLNNPEPLRNLKVWARGGWGGILLTETTTGSDGRYVFDDLCGSVHYRIRPEANSPSAWITSDGIYKNTWELGDVGPDQPDIVWTTNDRNARWLVAAQMGRQLAEDMFHFSPKPPKIVNGGPGRAAVGLFTPSSMTACGQLSLITPLAGPVGVVLAASMNGDIYPAAGADNDVSVAIHEYGHFTMCEALRQLGGDEDRFLNAYSTNTLSTGSDNNKNLCTPMRSSAEAFADYFAFHAYRYTNYFKNDKGKSVCGSSGSNAMCLETDSDFVRGGTCNPDDRSNRQIIASATSVMYDFTDTGLRKYGFPAPPLRDEVDDDPLHLPSDAVVRGYVQGGTDISTSNIAAIVASNASYAKPAEGVCQVMTRHGWGCSGVSVAGVHLSAPTFFDGEPVSETSIRWKWSPMSRLAATSEVVNATATGFADVASVPVDTIEYTQTIPGALPNTRVTAAVEARAPGAVAARSVRSSRCTRASRVTSLSAVPGEGSVTLRWNADRATDYVVARSDGKGLFDPIGTVAASAAPAFTDASVIGGAAYAYRVQARNCDGIETDGTPVSINLSADTDATTIFVRAGATGTGTRANPFGTLAAAITALTPARSRIDVAAGAYPERLRFDGTAPAGVGKIVVAGGYDATFTTRKPDTTASTLTGDGTTWNATVPDGDFSEQSHPVIYSYNRQVTVDGFTVTPVLRACGTDLSCGRFTLATAVGASSLTLRKVRYTGPRELGSLLRYHGAVRCSDDCAVEDSRIEEATTGSTDSPPVGINAFHVQVSGTYVSVENGMAMGATSAIVDRSVLRGTNDRSFFQTGTIALESGEVRVTNSILAGADAFLASPPPPAARSYIINSLMAGRTTVQATTLINDVFYGNFLPLLTVQAPGNTTNTGTIVLTGQEIRNNLFTAYNLDTFGAVGDRHIVTADVNSAMAWFGSASNIVRDNIANGDPTLSFALLTADPTTAFRPLPGRALTHRAGGSTGGVSVPVDIDGTLRGALDIGPYYDPTP